MSKIRLTTIVSLDVCSFSKMMEASPKKVLAGLNTVFETIVKPEVTSANGRVVKLLGDGAILEFGSATEAVSCAASIQKRLREGFAIDGIDEPILLRAGIHAGDVLIEKSDIFGDAVNIASRLQVAAEPGGILLSKTVATLAGNAIEFNLRREGSRRFKNILEPIETLSVDFSGSAAVFDAQELTRTLEIKFCKSSDGQPLAWSAVGEGEPIVKAANWIGHIELDWRNPSMAAMFNSLSSRKRFIYYDARGNGLSEWDMPDISFDLMVDDLEAVFDAAGVKRAPVFAISQGCAIAAAFAARSPERVSSIVMIGGYAVGRAMRNSEGDKKRAEALRAMMSAGWDDDYPSLRDLMSEMIAPGINREDRLQYAEDMRQMISPENLGRYREVVDNIDVTGLLGDITCPCLVIHSRGDKMQPIEQGRKMAAGIPNARFVPIESDNHSYPESDPAWPIVEREVDKFLKQSTQSG